MKFDNKVFLITGGGGGVGSAVAKAAAARGAKVVVVDRHLAPARSVAAAIRESGGQAEAFEADVSRAEEVQKYVKFALDRFGTIDCFANNAGILGAYANITDYAEADFDKVMGVNAKGVFLGMKYVLPVMLANGRGTVVNTASTSSYVASPGMTPYAASKAAVLMLTAGAAGEVGKLGVRVNCICPGGIQTGILDELKRKVSDESSDVLDQRFQAFIPTGRYTTTEEVANLVLFLCSDLSGNINGAAYLIDGGRLNVSPSFPAPAKP